MEGGTEGDVTLVFLSNTGTETPWVGCPSREGLQQSDLDLGSSRNSPTADSAVSFRAPGQGKPQPQPVCRSISSHSKNPLGSTC